MNARIIEKIEAYLDGEISRQKLEQQLLSEGVSDIEEQIAWVKNTRLAIEAEGLKDQLDEWFKNKKTSEDEGKVRKLRWRRSSWLVAASIALLIVGYFVINQFQSSLYDKYRYVDPGVPTLMSDASNYALEDAMTYYSEGNYQTAYAKLQALYDPANPNDTISYYLGAIVLYEGKPADSRSYFQEVLDDPGSAFRDKAEWLLALSYLQEGDKQRARQALDRILNKENHLFYQKAKKLREEID